MVEVERPRLALLLSCWFWLRGHLIQKVTRRKLLPTRSHSFYSVGCNWILWQIRHFRANMKTLSNLTFAFAALLLSVGWIEIRTAQAQSDPPAAAEKPAEATSSDANPAEKPAPATSTPEDAAAANMLLAEGRKHLEDRQSLQAEMRQEIFVYERKLTAEGTYVSGARYPMLRLEYRIRVGSMQGSLVEVCDGQILHTQKTIGKVGAKEPEQQFTRRDVQRILSARDSSLNASLASQGAELGMGGLPAMLASIDRCMVGKRVTEEEFDGRICRVFHGVWDQEVLKKYQAALQGGMAQLVPFFPDKVRVYFTADTVTPVKIVYIKDDLSETGQITGERTLMVLELRNLKLDEPIPPTTFQFTLPPKREEIDKTNEFLEIIKQADAALKGKPASPASR